MYLKDASIIDFRGIEDIDLKFAPGVNLLIGDNAAGKTSILEALAVGLSGLFVGMPGISANGFQREDFRQGVLRVTGASNAVVYNAPRVGIVLDINGTNYSCSRKRDDPSGDGTSSTAGSETKKYLQNLANVPFSKLPVLEYMSISRVISSKRADFGRRRKNEKNELNDRRCGYMGCLDGVPSKSSIMDWIMKMSYEAHFQNTQFNEVDLFNSTISKIMTRMDEQITDPLVRYSPVYRDVSFTESEHELPVSYLSAGYQSILWIAMDLAFRLAQLNPTMKDSSEATGIVLIDEIDMHLHPKWQWNVIGALERTFPNVQFIIATHAPAVISSCKNAKIISVSDSHEISYLANYYAESIDSIVDLTQRSSAVPPDLKNKFKEFERAFAAKNRELCVRIMEEIEEKYSDENSLYQEAALRMEMRRSWE